MLKKFITYILTVCMVCSLACSIPFTADAAGPVQYSTIIVKQNPKPLMWDMSVMSSADGGYTFSSGELMITNNYAGTISENVYRYTTPASGGNTMNLHFKNEAGDIISQDDGIYTIEIPVTIKKDSGNTGGSYWVAKTMFALPTPDYANVVFNINGKGPVYKKDLDNATANLYKWIDANTAGTTYTFHMVINNTGDNAFVNLYLNNNNTVLKLESDTYTYEAAGKLNNISSIHMFNYASNNLTNFEIGNVALWQGGKDDKPGSFKDVEWNIVGNDLVFTGAPSTSYNIKAKNLGSNVDVYTSQIETNEHGKAELSLGGLSSDNISNPGKYLVYLSDIEYEGVANAGISIYVGAEAMLDNVDTYIGSAASAEDKNIFKQCFMKNTSIDASEAQAVMDMYTALDSESKTYVAEETSAQNGFAEFSKLVKLTSLWGGALPSIPVDSSANSIITVTEAGSVKPSYWDVSSTNGKAAAISSTNSGTDRHKASITVGDYVHELHYNNSTSDAAPVISYEDDNIVYTMRSASTDEIRFTNTDYNLIDMTKDGVYTFKLPLSANAAMDVACYWNDGPSYWTAGATAYSKLCGTVQLSGDNTVKNLYMQFTSIAINKMTVDVYWGDTKLGTYESAYNNSPAGGAVAGMVSGISLKVSSAASGNQLKLGDIKFWSSSKANEPSDDNLTCSFDSESGKLTIDGEAGEEYLIRLLKPVGISGIDAFTSVYDENIYEGVKTLTDICGYELTSATDEHREYTLPTLNPGMYKLDIFKPGSGTPIYSTEIYNKINSILVPSDIIANITDADFVDVYKNAGYSADEATEIQTAASSVSDGSALSSMTELDISKLYAAVVARSLVENKLSDDASVNSVLSKLSDLGIDTTAFVLLKANNDRAVVMDEIYAVNPTTFTELVTELKSIAVLNGVKNALVDSEAQTFISTIGNTKYDGADENGKLAIAAAVKGGDYLTIEALSAAMDGVTLEPGSALGNNNNNNNNNNNYTGDKLDTGSSGGGTSIPVIPVIPQGSKYSDVPDNHWASQYIEAMTKQGIVSGYNGSFNPDNTVTRAEYLKMLCGIFKVDGADSTDFADVLLTDWYAPYVGGAKKAGLIEGTGTGFNPNGDITRQDAAVMLTRFMKYAGIELDAGGDLNYSDADDISDYANEAIQILTGMGILNGVGDGRVAPLDLMTRAQAAKMLFFAID